MYFTHEKSPGYTQVRGGLSEETPFLVNRMNEEELFNDGLDSITREEKKAEPGTSTNRSVEYLL